MCGFLFVQSGEDLDEVKLAGKKLEYRGPDFSSVESIENIADMLFYRLAIMDLSDGGNQPFTSTEGTKLICNGEIYNFKSLKAVELVDYPFTSESDCEVIAPLIDRFGLEKTCNLLDGEFAFVSVDLTTKKVVAARDPMGIRPLFYGLSKKTKKVCFASEMKSLIDLCTDIRPFPPGHYYDGENIVSFHDLTDSKFSCSKLDDALIGIREKFEAGVVKRLQSDAPIGFLLSGGLDSSLVCSIAAKHLGKITTFSVGINEDPIDTKYARDVAEYLGTDHHEYLFTKEDIFSCLDQLVYHLETYDITTIRASVGMYLLCKYIKEKTDIKVVLTGEVSDEIFGYKYTDFAPSPEEFQNEAKKRVKELYMYDVLRADRCISANSLEARVPFSDKFFVDYVMGIDPKIKMNSYDCGKYLLRKAFDDETYLPKHILYREKAAFSDAVGHSAVDYLKAHAEKIYTDEDLVLAKDKYDFATPFTKESLLYRDLFEKHFQGKAKTIKGFWMPNREWDNCDVDDPSARVLPNYGQSGS